MTRWWACLVIVWVVAVAALWIHGYLLFTAIAVWGGLVVGAITYVTANADKWLGEED